MYNFLLVLRALIANRFCYICDLEGREVGRRSWEIRNLTSRIRRHWKCSQGVLIVSRKWWVVNTEVSLCQNLRVVKENKIWSEPVSGFQITESGTFHYLNAWCRIGVDEPIRWLSKRNSSTKTEPQSPNQSSVHWSGPSVKLFVCLKCVTRLYSVQWERWHTHVMWCKDGG